MPHCHIVRITQIPNLEIGCKTLYRVQNRRNCGRYIGSMPIYRRFWVKNAISVWMCQIIATRCRKPNIGALSGLYRGYLEHWVLVEYTKVLVRIFMSFGFPNASLHFARGWFGGGCSLMMRKLLVISLHNVGTNIMVWHDI